MIGAEPPGERGRGGVETPGVRGRGGVEPSEGAAVAEWKPPGARPWGSPPAQLHSSHTLVK